METMMDLIDDLMLAGIGLMLGACALLIAAQLRDKPAGQDPVARNARRALRLDFYLGLVWSGFLVVQIGSILHHVNPDGTMRFSWLSLTAFAAVVFICGVSAGRLLLRRELRLAKERHEYPAKG
jgi:hypothetical protein